MVGAGLGGGWRESDGLVGGSARGGLWLPGRRGVFHVKQMAERGGRCAAGVLSAGCRGVLCCGWSWAGVAAISAQWQFGRRGRGLARKDDELGAECSRVRCSWSGCVRGAVRRAAGALRRRTPRRPRQARAPAVSRETAPQMVVRGGVPERLRGCRRVRWGFQKGSRASLGQRRGCGHGRAAPPT